MLPFFGKALNGEFLMVDLVLVALLGRLKSLILRMVEKNPLSGQHLQLPTNVHTALDGLVCSSC